MTVFYGKYHSHQVIPLSNKTFLPNWTIVDSYASQQFRAQSLTNNPSCKFDIVHDNKTGNVCISDAFISNKSELLSYFSFEKQNSRPLTNSQLILLAYQLWGINCVDRLCGDFVFTIWDSKISRLFLARDLMGRRAIFYHINTYGELCFSNTIKLLIEQIGINKEFNKLKVASFLLLSNTNKNEETLYENIFKLQAGHYLTISPNKNIHLKRFWSADQHIENPLIFSKRKEYYSYFRELFEEVVANYISQKDPISSHLSGGLDSSSISAMAAYLLNNQKRNLVTFGHIPHMQNSVSPKQGWNYSDRRYMEYVLECYPNMNHYYIRVDKDFDFTLRFKSWLDQPALNPSNMSWIMACVEQAKLENISTILTGEGGNFTISWPLHPIKPNKSRTRQLLSSIKQTYLTNLSSKYWVKYSAINPELAKITNETYNLLQENRKLSIEEQRSFFFDNSIADYSSSIYMPIRQLYKINHLDPTVDRRIIEFCLRTPLHIFQEDDRSRLLIRDGLSDILPKSISDRLTRGMQSADWHFQFECKKNIYFDWLNDWKQTHIAEYIDIPLLISLLKSWDHEKVKRSQGKSYSHFNRQYKLKFLRAIEMGVFLS